jgi:hypothetical protein
MTHLELLTVCLDHADVLEHTLPSMLRRADDVYIVTAPRDRRTKGVCAGTKAHVIETDELYDEDGAFFSGRAINEGLKYLQRDDWVLALDADCLLCGRYDLRKLPLDPRKLYGVDRFHCRGFDRYSAWITSRVSISRCAVPTPEDLPLAKRIGILDNGGYLPCGFFQLWNPGVSGVRDYVVGRIGKLEGSDMLQAARWYRSDRELLPEVFVIELTTAPPGAIGPNWGGRTTPEFSAEGGPYQR